MSGRITFAGVGRRPRWPKSKSMVDNTGEDPKAHDNQLDVRVYHLLPADVLASVFNQLEVCDLCSAAQADRAWKEVIYQLPEAGFRQCFIRDYGLAAATPLAHLKTWRQRYIACTIEKVCRSLRDKASYLDELEDTSAALERSLQSTLAQLNQLDRTLSHRRWDLNRVLAEVAAKPSAHAGSRLGREILEAAKAEVERAAAAGSSGSGSGRAGPAVAAEGGEGLWYEGWRMRLTGEMCHCLVEAERDVSFWMESLREQKESLRAMMSSLSYVTDCIRNVKEGIHELRSKKAALEAATTYRHVMRRA